LLNILIERMAVGGKLVALHDYEPQQPDELAMKKGDIILLKEEIEDGWAVGVRLKRNGEVNKPDSSLISMGY